MGDTAAISRAWFFPRDRRGVLALILLAALAFLYLSLFKDALIDDAYITLRYVKTLATSGTWGFFPGYAANTATSPLNVLLLTAVSLLSRDPVASVVWLGVVELVALALFLRGIGQQLGLRWFAPLAFVGLAFNPLLLSTLGLESVLFTTLMCAALYFWSAKRFYALALACALVTLTRPDGILLFGFFLVFMPNVSARVRAVFLYAVCLMPWYLFSWVYLGSLLPDSFFIKVAQKWGTLAFLDGLRLYLARYPLPAVLSIAYAPFALLAIMPPVRKLGAILLIIAGFGVVHYAGYALLRVPPYHWYYVPSVVGLVLLGALGVSVLFRDTRGQTARGGATALVVLGLIVPLGGTVWLMVTQVGVPLNEAFIHTNWATPQQYRAIGQWLGSQHGNETGASQVEIGTLVYYCDCALRDPFGDRTWVQERAARFGAPPGIFGAVVRLNFLWLRPQPPFPPDTYTLEYSETEKNPDLLLPAWLVSSRWRQAGYVTFAPN